MTDSWKDAVVASIRNSRRRVVPLQTIYALMKTHHLVTPYHEQAWAMGGQPRYECWIRSELARLVRDRSVNKVGRGKYSLPGSN